MQVYKITGIGYSKSAQLPVSGKVIQYMPYGASEWRFHLWKIDIRAFFTERLVDVKFQNTGAFNKKVIKRFINADHNWRFHPKTRRLPLKQFMSYKNMPTVIVVSR